MNRVSSNGPLKDFVINPYTQMIQNSTRLWIAAPYVTMTEELVSAARSGKYVCLLVGLNPITTPEALDALHGLPNCAVRYFTHRFHAKVYLFDREALVGSSNLTDGGLRSNREATVRIHHTDDLDELRALFNELWDSAQVLTTEKLRDFTQARRQMPVFPHVDPRIENAIGRAEPINSNVASMKKSKQSVFLEQLRREVYEQYRPSFTEVTRLLEANDFRRKELEAVGVANETNRFLNWVRLTYALGQESWEQAPLRAEDSRRSRIIELGRAWTQTDNDKIPPDYIDWLRKVTDIFSTKNAITDASKDDITEGLLSLHAFNEQLRFVKGGLPNLPAAFWEANGNDLARAKRTITHFLHGDGDFIQRLHDVLYDPSFKLGLFGKFCALELYGTVKPNECPPMNGRMAKALRYLGFDVRPE